MKKIGRFNILQETVCHLGCNCGFNIHIGGKDRADLVRIKKLLKDLSKATGHKEVGDG